MCKINKILDKKSAYFEMGTGKTCTAIAAIEQVRYEKSSHIKRALIFAKGSRLIKNFIQELLFTCTDGRYIPDNFKCLTDLEKVRRVRKITSEFYNFFTFEKFAKYLTKLSDRDIINQFSNSIIVIDEVHNIREKIEKHQNKDDFFKKESFDVYKQFHRMFHLIKYSKILLMSGTVMKSGKITNQHSF
ncbi:MAG: DEAD/DEAH box helicase family protein [Cetobacterium sp.]